MKTEKNWARLLAYVTGLVNQELILQNEYLAAENRILRAHLPSRLRLSSPERETLAEIGKRLGRKALGRVACVAKPDTILAWYRKLVAQKFDGSKHRSYPGRPRISPEAELLIVQFARENAGWGYDRIAGLTRHPTEPWMEQMAPNATDESTGCLRELRYVLHDRDTEFCTSVRSILRAAGVEPVRLPARSPDLNAFAERWVRSVKEECLSKLILFGEGSLTRALAQFLEHYHSERPHQGKGNVILFPTEKSQTAGEHIVSKHRLGGLLRYYCRAA